MQQIMNNVIIHPRTRCWMWTAAVNNHGYGLIKRRRQKDGRYAHRVAYKLFKGDIPDGLFVLHKCDTPRCVNPEHLSLGTQSDNIKDCASKGRLVDNSGERHGMAKLDPEKVSQIRASDAKNGDLAKQYNVSETTIRFIRQRKLWKHI